ncbi:nucleotide sugar dehydrogenase [Enterococcus faecium]|uniref:nucleotide sugar dehydrogenase n=1 Tax=Enterococcus faecium TaxID=1352 RepID=UPI0009C02DCD|nr:nucleotide sugar dehydrogenase [Enterococcus faecium]EGP4779052.1 nucleotide sugar dehydrogenase [Enterococcus faecium]EGP4884906.1 nucleotide sugar dehydrogenase [Enterococcus faecium]EGP5097881.1 nucleotide sugar dehydrogenase [Enterococcus faecium]EGP5146285.1 nucleotide sugar dehydrogenase [Enterococcus faecium]EJC3744297.1 nucleotide sugar dehydrogenase [Enterococcus faecium]
MFNLYEKLVSKKENLSLIGLGYVGMPIAISFSKEVNVIGFDTNEQKIDLYKRGIDPTLEVGDDAIASSDMLFTSDPSQLRRAKFHIVAVPTPINQDKTPDLSPIEGASKVLGENLTRGSIIVYESTVYPGATEEICIPILEKYSGLKCGVDFKVGYSPERINPGDKIHTLEKIVKIVSGMDEETRTEIAKVYELVISAGVHLASSIKVAEAAKVVENSQRDINIAFMNELAMVFDKMGISSIDVIEAMNTKWNALKFYPGLVGGHCISVDPYYFISEAEKLGYHSQIVSAGRKINDSMGEFVASATIKELVKTGKKVKDAKVGILGFTFKENCPDTRNTKVIDIYRGLREYDINALVSDPYADKEEVEKEYGIELTDYEKLNDLDCLIFAVNHKEYNKDFKEYEPLFISNEKNVVIDVKSILSKDEVINKNFRYWSL